MTVVNLDPQTVRRRATEDRRRLYWRAKGEEVPATVCSYPQCGRRRQSNRHFCDNADCRKAREADGTAARWEAEKFARKRAWIADYRQAHRAENAEYARRYRAAGRDRKQTADPFAPHRAERLAVLRAEEESSALDVPELAALVRAQQRDARTSRWQSGVISLDERIGQDLRHDLVTSGPRYLREWVDPVADEAIP